MRRNIYGEFLGELGGELKGEEIGEPYCEVSHFYIKTCF